MINLTTGQAVTLASGVPGTVVSQGAGDADWYRVRLPYGTEWIHRADLAPVAPECVGFAECPCAKHRASRLAATDSHPDHSTTDRGLCGACRTATRQEA